jgi:superfamily II DNA or RNA helicase
VTLKLNSNIILKCCKEAILNQCINENTFENPSYISNEENGRSNWNTERFITTYRHEDDSIILPRGFMRDLLKILKEHEITSEIIDERVSSPCHYQEKLNEIVLRPYQLRAVEEALKYDQGAIVSPTGSGKSLIGLEIIRRRGEKAIIIVHRSELAKQWIKVIEERLGIKSGFIGDGEWGIGDQITVAMVQTLASSENNVKLISDSIGLVLVDEGHHLPSDQFFSIINLLAAKYRYMMSATPNRRDGLETMIYRAIGPAIATISRDEVEDLGATIPATVVQIQTGFNPGLVNSWSEYLDSLTANADRNIRITNLAKESEGVCTHLSRQSRTRRTTI